MGPPGTLHQRLPPRLTVTDSAGGEIEFSLKLAQDSVMPRGIPESDLFSESIYFRSCCSITGAVRHLHSCRRNGYPMLVFSADVAEPDPEPDESELTELIEELSYNLNPLERRTWLKLMDGQPIEHIAADEGVTRTAIYE